MATSLKKEVLDHLKKVSKAYKVALKPFGASGETERSVRPAVTEESGNTIVGKVYGSSSIYYLKHGRGPGKFPPVSAMLAYVRNKRSVKIGKGQTENTVAYLTGKSIAEKGTRIFRGKVKGLNVDDQVAQLSKEFALAVQGRISGAIKQSMKGI